MIRPVFLKLHASEEMHIGGVGIQIGEGEGNLGLGDRLILLGIINKALLDEVTAPSAPAGPEAEFEESYRKSGGWNGPDNADQRLLTAQLGANILA